MPPKNTLAAKRDLREKIIKSLKAQGFRIRQGNILPPKILSKEGIRNLHKTAVSHKIHRSERGLFSKEKELLRFFADGNEVDAHRIRPRLIEVVPRSSQELLFRYASLHWSIPVSSGYGRRLRFLLIDESNEKLIGIMGLGDPVFSLGPRDDWVGWSTSQRRHRLKNVLDAFVLGAVPPYSFLLCGKLVSMMVASDTVRSAFKSKYGGQHSLIEGKPHDGRLAMVTTTSALGRSSVYNRLKLHDRLLFHSVGFTKGSGEFQFSNGLYGAISEFALANCEPTAKHSQWGHGFRNRREVIKKSLPALGLPGEWLYHGIEREIFVIPLAHNTREFLRDQHSRLLWYHHSEQEIFDYFRERWLLPRSQRDDGYKNWKAKDWSIWTSIDDDTP